MVTRPRTKSFELIESNPKFLKPWYSSFMLRKLFSIFILGMFIANVVIAPAMAASCPMKNLQNRTAFSEISKTNETQKTESVASPCPSHAQNASGEKTSGNTSKQHSCGNICQHVCLSPAFMFEAAMDTPVIPSVQPLWPITSALVLPWPTDGFKRPPKTFL